MSKILGFLAALAVFAVWLGILANPNVVSNLMQAGVGLVLAATSGLWVHFKVKKFYSHMP